MTSSRSSSEVAQALANGLYKVLQRADVAQQSQIAIGYNVRELCVEAVSRFQQFELGADAFPTYR
jgi:hypothetical protein